MQGLVHLKNATTVNVSGCPNLTDKGLVHLKNATTVDVSACPKITDAGASSPQKCYRQLM